RTVWWYAGPTRLTPVNPSISSWPRDGWRRRWRRCSMTGDEPARYDEMTFEELVATLEELTDRMASGQIGIEEAADLYEEAERLHERATERVGRVQARIED